MLHLLPVNLQHQPRPTHGLADRIDLFIERNEFDRGRLSVGQLEVSSFADAQIGNRHQRIPGGGEGELRSEQQEDADEEPFSFHGTESPISGSAIGRIWVQNAGTKFSAGRSRKPPSETSMQRKRREPVRTGAGRNTLSHVVPRTNRGL